MKILGSSVIPLCVFLVSCGSGNSADPQDSFDFSVNAVSEAYDYSIVEIKVNSSSALRNLQFISDELVLIASNTNSLSVLLPIVFTDTTFEYQVRGTNSVGISATVNKEILVKIYRHRLNAYTELRSTGGDNLATGDYKVFNFSFEAIRTDEGCLPVGDRSYGI